MCKRCAYEVEEKEKSPALVTTEPEYQPKKSYGSEKVTSGTDMCSRCPKVAECHERVEAGLPVLCELWDEWDLEKCLVRADNILENV